MSNDSHLKTKWERHEEYMKKYHEREPFVLFPFTPTETIWEEKILPVLNTKFESVKQLEAAIASLCEENPDHSINFFTLYYETQHEKFMEWRDKSLEFRKKDYFFSTLLPFIQQLARDLPTTVPKLPILVPNKEGSIHLHQRQIACILANAFFCTFDTVDPARFTGFKFPTLSFRSLYAGMYHSSAMECILNYFYQIQKSMPQGTVEFYRKALTPERTPNWAASTKKMAPVKVLPKGLIELSKARYHADFANEFLGGGVLHGGNVQEEILFLIKPECLAGLLFCAKMKNNEAIGIRGAQRYSSYSGYGFHFEFADAYDDKSIRDAQGNIRTIILAFDAIVSFDRDMQFKQMPFDRDLNKAYIAFSKTPHEEHIANNCNSNAPEPNLDNTIATGNWGCGAFGGDKHLKFIQQLMAASEAERELEYYTFNDEKLSESLTEIYDFLVANQVTVGQLYQACLAYDPSVRFFAFLKHKLGKTQV
mmetsp:Transcript_24235/g.33983  ORF Transcript_24235/g.33983 Transcript_24235/m.33983 type:complete len:479 (+) Transcript_24235:60-1496(+)